MLSIDVAINKAEKGAIHSFVILFNDALFYICNDNFHISSEWFIILGIYSFFDLDFICNILGFINFYRSGIHSEELKTWIPYSSWKIRFRLSLLKMSNNLNSKK